MDARHAQVSLLQTPSQPTAQPQRAAASWCVAPHFTPAVQKELKRPIPQELYRIAGCMKAGANCAAAACPPGLVLLMMMRQEMRQQLAASARATTRLWVRQSQRMLNLTTACHNLVMQGRRHVQCQKAHKNIQVQMLHDISQASSPGWPLSSPMQQGATLYMHGRAPHSSQSLAHCSRPEPLCYCLRLKNTHTSPRANGSAQGSARMVRTPGVGRG